MRLIGLTLLAGLTACASDVRLRQPPLPTEGSVAPLTASIEVARVGWGPFNQSCQEMAGEERGLGSSPLYQPRTCILLNATPSPSGKWRVTTQQVSSPHGPIAIGFSRDERGSISDFALFGQGLTNVDPVRRQQVEAVLRDAMSNLGLQRRTIAPGSTFALRGPPNFGLFSQVAFTCVVRGTAPVRHRLAVIGDCAGTTALSGSIPPSARSFAGTLTYSGQAAVDIETGLIVANSIGLTMAGVVSDKDTGRQGQTTLNLRMVNSLE